jgi:hypothetical protein
VTFTLAFPFLGFVICISPYLPTPARTMRESYLAFCRKTAYFQTVSPTPAQKSRKIAGVLRGSAGTSWYLMGIYLYFWGGYSQKDRPPSKVAPPPAYRGLSKSRCRDWLVPHGTVIVDRPRTFHLLPPLPRPCGTTLVVLRSFSLSL